MNPRAFESARAQRCAALQPPVARRGAATVTTEPLR